MAPEITDQARDARELSNRIREVVASFPSKVAAAKTAGVSPQQITNLINGKNAPSFMPLARMAMARGFSLEWLASGRTPKMSSPRYVEAPILESAARAPAADQFGATKMRVVLKVFEALRLLYVGMNRSPAHNDLQDSAVAVAELVALGAALEKQPELDDAVGEIAMRIHKQAQRLNAPRLSNAKK